MCIIIDSTVILLLISILPQTEGAGERVITVPIDVQRTLNYLLMILAVAGGIVFGALAGRLIDLSLMSDAPGMTAPLSRRVLVKPLQEKDFQIILSRNLFNSEASGETELVDLSSSLVRQETAAQATVALTELKLIGTVVGDNSLAVINQGNKTAIFRLGEELAPRVTLEEITRKMVVILDHGQRREIHLLPQQSAQPQRISAKGATDSYSGEGIVPVSDGRWQISKTVADHARANLNSLLRTARVIPEVKNGNTVGFRMVELQKGSLLEKIGLQVGDLIVEINQVELNSPEKALQIFQQVREANNISLGLMRDGQPRTFEYRFE